MSFQLFIFFDTIGVLVVRDGVSSGPESHFSIQSVLKKAQK